MPKISKKNQPTQEDCIQTALEALCAGEFPSILCAAKAYDIPHETLSKSFRGLHSNARSGHSHLQILAPVVESVLVDWCIFSGAMGVPWTKENLLAQAQELAGPRVTISLHWCHRFLECHASKLKFRFAYKLDPKHASGFN